MFGNFDDVKSIFINLLSNLIWFAAGLVSGVIIATGKRWLRPRVWSEMLQEKVVLVVGSHGDFDSYDASGMIGTGDALALAEFVSYFRQIGFENYEVAGARSMAAQLIGRNLILIGGPDANDISRDFIERTEGQRKTRFGDPQLHEISFELDGQVYAPSGGAVRTDAAAVLFLDSPFSADASVVLVSGCYGHGTHAAAKLLCNSKSFARKTKQFRRFEAALTCEIVKHEPTAIELQSVIPG